MSLFEDQLAQLSRRPAWLLKLYPDYCANEFGVSPCTAAGTPCYFTYPTCKDKAHYLKTVKEYAFCEKDGLWLKDALPYIKSISFNSMELDPKDMRTTRANLTINLYDDLPHYFANPDKADSNIETAGSFWKNWLARNPNYFRRLAELHLAFKCDPLLVAQLLDNAGMSTVYPDGRIGQTFSSSGEWLEGITIKYYLPGNNSSCQFALELYTTSNGLPDTLLMTSEAMTFLEPAPSPNGTPREVYIPMQYQMPAGLLAFAIKPLDNKSGGVRISGYNPFTGGNYVIKDNWTHVWSADASKDLYFKIFTRPLESKLYFRGVMEKIEQKQNEVVLTIKDLLKNLDADSHYKQSDNVVSAMAYTGGNYLNVYYGHELPAYGVLCSESGKYIKYSGITGPDDYGNWTLTNCQYSFGSSGTIESGEKLQQHLVYARDDNGMADGLTADMILLDLLCNRAGIEPQYIAVTDSGATLMGGISGSDTTISVSDGSLLPDQGVIKIDDEFIIYGSKCGNVLDIQGGASIPIFYYHKRGAFRTAADSHSAGAKVYIPTITRECLAWLNGCLFRADIGEPEKIQELVNQICQQALLQLWQNENGEIQFQELAPPRPDESIETLDDDAHLVENSIEVIDDPGLQHSRILVFYSPTEANPGDAPDKYQALLEEIDADIEGVNWLNETKPDIIYANWIYRHDEALALASRLLALSREGILEVGFKLEMKDLETEIGGFIYLNTARLVDADGNNKLGCYEIVSKKPVSSGKYQLQVMRFNFLGTTGLIGPENPTLYSAIDNDDTIIVIQLTDSSYANNHFADAGQIRIEDEKISYTAKSYDAGTLRLTLTNCTRGALGTTPVAHDADVDVLLLFAGSSATASSRWAWIGDSDNELDGDGNGTNETQGYVIW